MKSILASPNPDSNRSNTTRREFLKSTVATSIAATAAGIVVASDSADAMPQSETGDPSIIAITGATPSAPLRKPWKTTIASGYAALQLREDLHSQMTLLQQKIGYGYCRFHGIFHDNMAVVARRKDGTLAFRWAQVDKVYDSLLQIGIRPHVELSTMPVALASGTTTIDDWQWNTTPPRDYAEWGQLVEAFARHCQDRYGLDEIAQWYYEVWNEPNINYWTGTQEDYWKLYDVSAAALKAVSPRLRVGGPVTAHASWVPAMIEHCSTKGVPLDFISTHIYPQDEFVEYPGLRNSPYKPGMFVPDVVRRVREAVRKSAMPDLEVQFTEWNSLVPFPDGKVEWDHNPSVEDMAAAATVCDLAIAVDEDCETFCWWDASDVFAEGGMPQSEFSGTYGLLTLNGLPKATFNAFSFLNRLRGGRLGLRHEALAPGQGLVATAEGQSRQILLWYRDLSAYGVAKQQPWSGVLEVPWTESAKPVLLQERITAGAGSCYETWQSLGTPQNLSPVEYELLKAHAVPEARLFRPEAQSGRVTHNFRLAVGEVLYLEMRPEGAVALPNGPLNLEVQAWYAAHRRAK